MSPRIPHGHLRLLLPLLCLFLLAGVLAVGSEKDQIGLEQLEVSSNLSAVSITSPTQDTILYDNNTAQYLDTVSGSWTGVRFTPVNNLQLQAIYFAILNQYNNTTDGCSLYVVEDDGSGDPDWPSGILAGAWVPPTLPDLTWMQVDLLSPVSFSANEDFHIFCGPAPAGPYPGTGWWNILDSDGSATQRSRISLDDRSTWLTITDADAFIRAGGEYASVPSDFHLVGVSGGWAPWTRLLRLEIDSTGFGTYSIMYPEDRDTGIYTLLDTFYLGAGELATIYGSATEHDFFGLDTMYQGSAVDGSFCDLKFTAGGMTHRVVTTNMEVPPFDSLVREINAVTPGGLDLIYNELYPDGGPEPPEPPIPPKKTVVSRILCTIFVDLYIEFYGTCATQDVADAWETNIENAWNNNGNYLRYGCCPCGCGCGCQVIFNVITNVRDEADPPTDNYHQINIPCDSSASGDSLISHVHLPLPQPNGASGSGDWDNNEPANTAAHEAGHLMGLDDHYTVVSQDPYITRPDSGHENDIMATLSGGALQSAIDEIVEDAGVDCPWYCCPCDWFVFVSDLVEPNNRDIYIYDLLTGVPTRLTTDPGIDNHPDTWSNLMVWSSNGNYLGTNPEGDFELYLADMTDIPGSIEQLTFNDYPDRHPHFNPDGSKIVFSSKRKCGQLKRDQCSIPVDPECDDPDTSGGPFDGSLYEGLNVYDRIEIEIVQLDLRSASPIWPSDNATNEGHASFSHDGTQILFAADTAGHGASWEVYVMDFDPTDNSISNLEQVTEGPALGPNPIEMSAGAHFSEDDSKIIFSSTRTPMGNSQLFEVLATDRNMPVTQATRLTDHCANDYVPEPMCRDRIAFVSDRGSPNSVCEPCGPDVESPTYDLDLFMMNSDGSGQTNLTDNDDADETLLLGDEVSWFCGIKPNLSPCTYYPKIWEMCWINTVYLMAVDPTYLPDFPNRELYPVYWHELNNYMMLENPEYWMYILEHMGDEAFCHERLVIPSLSTAVPDSTFTMECSPDLNHTSPGGPPAYYNIDVGSVSGYSLNVNLQLGGVVPPAAILASFAPNDLAPPYTSDVAVLADISVAPGTYILTFQGTGDDGQTNECQVILVVLPEGVCGDVTADRIIDLGDVVYVLGYLYKGGPPPEPACLGDVNCDGIVDLGDVVYLITYLYKGGPLPCPECCGHKAAMRTGTKYETQGSFKTERAAQKPSGTRGGLSVQR